MPQLSHQVFSCRHLCSGMLRAWNFRAIRTTGGLLNRGSCYGCRRATEINGTTMPRQPTSRANPEEAEKTDFTVAETRQPIQARAVLRLPSRSTEPPRPCHGGRSGDANRRPIPARNERMSQRVPERSRHQGGSISPKLHPFIHSERGTASPHLHGNMSASAARSEPRRQSETWPNRLPADRTPRPGVRPDTRPEDPGRGPSRPSGGPILDISVSPARAREPPSSRRGLSRTDDPRVRKRLSGRRAGGGQWGRTRAEDERGQSQRRPGGRRRPSKGHRARPAEQPEETHESEQVHKLHRLHR
jgi:hypothetical protein